MLARPSTPLSVDPSHCLISIPKKGRLHDHSVQLMKEIGLHFKRSTRSDIAHCTAAPVSLVFLNVVDIPMFVAEGTVDAGIVGQDVIAESGHELPDGMLLQFGKCVLALQAPSYLQLTPKDLIGCRVVTSFPRLTRKYFATLEEEQLKQEQQKKHCDQQQTESLDGQQSTSESITPTTSTNGNSNGSYPLKTRILALTGSVEASVSLGVGEGVVDLVETGDTMKMAGLTQIGEVMQSEAVFVTNPHTQHATWLAIIKKRIAGYLTAQKYQMITYNIHRDKLQQAAALTPGLRSPTINSLAEPDWKSITAVVERSMVLGIIDELDALDAQDILVYDFRHCRIGTIS